MGSSIVPASQEASTIGLKLEGINKRFGERWAARDFNLDVPRGKLLMLLGPSGSGKSTILNMIAGFLRPDSGRVIVDGNDLTNVPPHRRNFGMVFQASTLFPHLTVAENIVYGLKLRKVPAEEQKRHLANMLDLIGLQTRERAYPGQLSGGEQQRVGIARALVLKPRLFLLDEPLSNLDAKLRRQMREDIRTIQLRQGITTIMVTHDQEEALAIGDIVAVIDQGELQQVDTPEMVYQEPVNNFVAGFVGEKNLLPGKVVKKGQDRMTVELEGGLRFTTMTSGLPLTNGSPIVFVIAPEDVTIIPADEVRGEFDNGNWNHSHAVVRVPLFLGSRRRYVVDLEPGSLPMNIDAPSTAKLASGDAVNLYWRIDASRLIPK